MSAPPSEQLAPTLPDVTTALTSEQVVARLDQAARRGKVPGFAPGSGEVLFECEAFGQPFDGVLQAKAQRAGDQTTLKFATRMNRKMPWIFVIVSILTIWPGVWVTESMLATMFPGAKWLWGTTYWWYLILSVPTTPWYLWSAFKKSRVGMHADALERVAEIDKLLGAPSGSAPTSVQAPVNLAP